ncbi:hypothetical protein GCM10009564_49570 [Streptomyces thermogriseus]|uniref:Uncharacterized protein n=1 Tax=Streptomyces thermogriseus TaxID=75292 RepID=A0ABP4DPF2_9ACTN
MHPLHIHSTWESFALFADGGSARRASPAVGLYTRTAPSVLNRTAEPSPTSVRLLPLLRVRSTLAHPCAGEHHRRTREQHHGIGPAPRRRGTGLAGLKGRVVALDGTLRAGPEDGGFRLTAVLPLR